MTTPPVPPGAPLPEPPPYQAPPPGFGPQTTWPHGRPAPGYQPPSKATAGWALAMSLLICVPVVPAVVGVVLGVVVLRRCSDGRDHGRGLAIAAIIVGACVLALTVIGFGLGLLAGLWERDETTRNDDGEVVEAGEVTTTLLRVGDCFDEGALEGSSGELVESTSVEAKPCREPHQFEVYHEHTLVHDDYPGQRVVDRTAERVCGTQFAFFVGRPYDGSRLELYYYFPTEESWDVLDDRTVSCLVSDPAGPTRGSLRGADR